jgi:hypothetical protein
MAPMASQMLLLQMLVSRFHEEPRPLLISRYWIFIIEPLWQVPLPLSHCSA